MEMSQKEVIKYFRKRVSQLPYHECLINSSYLDDGLARLLISKKQPSGNYSFASFLIDTYCLGVKDVVFNANFSEDRYNEFKEKIFAALEVVPMDITDAHNLIYGIIDAAEEIGFRPPKDFAIAENILNPDLIDDGIDEVEFGKDGKPFYIKGLFDDWKKIMKTLERTVGEGNFLYMIDDEEIDEAFL